MSPTVESVEWAAQGAPPAQVVDEFGVSALLVAVLDALLDDPEAREKALRALGGGVGPTR